MAFRIQETRSPANCEVRATEQPNRRLIEAMPASFKPEELLRSILESTPNTIAVADRDGNLLFLSKAPAGRELAESLGQPAWQHLPNADQLKTKNCMERVLTTGIAEALEVRDESGRQWLSHVGPLRDGAAIVGTTSVAWDITKEAELEARLAVADRMASIGTLAAGVAHEINNLLTYLLVSLEMLEAGGLEREGSAHWLGDALDGARRIRDVVADLRSFSSGAERVPKLVDVQQLLESAVRMAHHEIRHRARVRRCYSPTPPVAGNDGWLGQVFLNLVLNAAQAIPEGNVEANEIVVATGVDDSGRVVVEISDTGAGMPPELLPKIFDPFMTTKSSDMGTGLGLYISRRVVRAIGGELDVKSSTLGAGTTFQVILPPCTVALPSPAEPEPLPAAPQRLRILVADDEAAIVQLMKRALRGNDVVIASSGREAIGHLASREFDLVFCDLMMPDMTGMDVHAFVRFHAPGQEKQIVLMTGGAFTERAQEFLARVSNVILRKPFAIADVVQIVARHVTSRSDAGAPTPIGNFFGPTP